MTSLTIIIAVIMIVDQDSKLPPAAHDLQDSTRNFYHDDLTATRMMLMTKQSVCKLQVGAHSCRTEYRATVIITFKILMMPVGYMVTQPTVPQSTSCIAGQSTQVEPIQ